MSGIFIFSPNRFSLYTICVTELLIRNNIDVKAIVVRRLFNKNRFLFEFSRDGSRLLKKILKKLILRKKAYTNSSYETIASFMKKENIIFKRVDNFYSKYKIPIIYCYDLNDSIVIESLKNIKPELVVFTGGGLIRKEVLANSGDGILNCHMGLLPRYRGMDVVEWPILEGNLEQVGVTVHFMNEGVDTGDILRKKKVKIETGESIKKIRERFEPIMCREIVEACLDCLKSRINRIPQKCDEGRQYFLMHKRLLEIVKNKLR